jgi:exosortase
LIGIVVLCLLPIRVSHEINADWPLCNWLLTLSLVILSLYAVFLAGGWPWVQHFGFSISFILIAVRWPYRIEHGLTQGLMRVVASLTVEVLGWFNIPAFQRGNLIEVSSGVVGIDEACSGIRSFLSTIMISLFLGELYRLSWAKRGLLLAGGVVIAFCLNVMRTFLLTWQVAKAGEAALQKWHDSAGITIFLGAFVFLWGFGSWLQRKSNEAPMSRAETLNLLVPKRFLAAVGCWALLVVTFTEVWYRVHEKKDQGLFYWSVALPEAKPSFEKIDLPPRSLKLLAFDSSATARWRETAGTEWSVFFFRWNPRSIQSVIQARLHRPDVCLPAAGLREVSEMGIQYFEVGTLKLPFRRYVYELEGRLLYVFFCQWEDGAENQDGLEASRQADRLRSVLAGRRILGQQTLEIILTGCDSLQKAEAELRMGLPELILPETARANVASGRS